MPQRIRYDLVILGHGSSSLHCASNLRSLLINAVIGLLTLGASCKVHAQSPTTDHNATKQPAPASCLPDGHGYLKARLSGALQAELVWGNEDTECTGAVRPDGGLRIRFSRYDRADDSHLVLLFGVAGLREGQSAKELPVNVTVIREGKGEFYSTQGDNKCTLDEVKQEPLVGAPYRTRSYRIIARGFCTQPARAVRGQGAVLLSRFDYAGRIDFESEPSDEQTPDQRATNARSLSSLKP